MSLWIKELLKKVHRVRLEYWFSFKTSLRATTGE